MGLLIIIISCIICLIKFVFENGENITHRPYYQDRNGKWRKWIPEDKYNKYWAKRKH